MHIHQTPSWLQNSFTSLTWKRASPQPSNKIYLTFDDGPIPEVSEFVLKCLSQHQIKATFFVVGDNVRKHPDILKAIIDDGHAIGNHTFNHLKGWETSNSKYFSNISACQAYIDSYYKRERNIFRPPYGRITPSQVNLLKNDYEIIMWDVLSCDYSPSLSAENCLKMTTKRTQTGSIIVFHDSLKSYAKLKTMLSTYIENMLIKGFEFEVL